MSQYGPGRPAEPPAHDTTPAAVPLYLAAGGLGVLSFVWGFLTWFSGAGSEHVGGYAVSSPATGVVALSLLTGAVATAHGLERRPASVLPLAVSVAALLLVVGVAAAKDDFGGEGGRTTVALGIGLILEIITVVLQVTALALAWLLATGRVASGRPRLAMAGPGYPPPYGPPPGFGYAPGYPGAAGFGAPGPGQPGFGPMPGYPPAPGWSAPGYGPPPGYHPAYQPGYGPQTYSPGQRDPGGAPARPAEQPTTSYREATPPPAPSGPAAERHEETDPSSGEPPGPPR